MKKTGKDYYQLFREAKDFNPSRFDEYEENLAFYEGQQHLLTKYTTEKPWVIDINSPYATYAIDNRVASLMANDYIGELEPLSPDDMETVEDLNNVYQNQWNALNMDNLINDSILRSAILREAYIHIVYNDSKVYGGTNRKRKGRLEAYFIDTASVLIDPKALSLKTADYVVVIERVTRERVKELYPSAKLPKEDTGSVYNNYDRGELGIDTDYNSEQEDVLALLTFYEKKGKKVKKTVLLEQEIVEATRELPINCLPIAQLRWEKKMKSPYGIALMDRLLPLQKSINSIESAITNTALAFAAPSFVVRRDSGLSPKKLASVAGAPGVVMSVNGDPSTAVKPLITNSIDGQMISVKQEQEYTMYKVAGVSDQFNGDIGSAGNTSSGTDNAIRRAKIIENKFLTNLEEFIEDITEILIKFVTKVFEGETLYSRGEKASNGKFEFNKFEVPVGSDAIEYTFYVNLDVKTPYSKEKEKDLLKDLYQFERQYDAPIKTVNIKDLLKTYDLTNRQEIVERYDEMVNQSNDKKATLINQWTSITQKHGISPEVVTAGITEILVGDETPTIDETVQMIEQQIAQQQAAFQQDRASLEAVYKDTSGGFAQEQLNI